MIHVSMTAMGMYNRLRLPAPIDCPACGVRGRWWVQFRFGPLALTNYEAGEPVDWAAGGRKEGRRGLGRVLIQGTLEECPNCRADLGREHEIVTIEVREDVFVSAVEDTSGDGYWPEFWRAVDD
ncbi:hypothetical protein [Microtetraspora malaysiensis]|uniref:hypothetical protein n=1 Tax=Microtetraspora malaysiensis TaxID=161358 RepID=UPI0012FB764E|nr:hypothetical protein [Microtetraspora malaysiensis]